MFDGKAKAYPIKEPFQNLSDAPLLGRLLALPTNNRLSWRGLAGTNTLAY